MVLTLLLPRVPKFKFKKKVSNFILLTTEKQIVSYHSIAENVSLEWPHHRTSPTDLKVRTALHVSIIDSENRRVKQTLTRALPEGVHLIQVWPISDQFCFGARESYLLFCDAHFYWSLLDLSEKKVVTVRQSEHYVYGKLGNGRNNHMTKREVVLHCSYIRILNLLCSENVPVKLMLYSIVFLYGTNTSS